MTIILFLACVINKQTQSVSKISKDKGGERKKSYKFHGIQNA
jgi:hypothetical protein